MWDCKSDASQDVPHSSSGCCLELPAQADLGSSSDGSHHPQGRQTSPLWPGTAFGKRDSGWALSSVS